MKKMLLLLLVLGVMGIALGTAFAACPYTSGSSQQEHRQYQQMNRPESRVGGWVGAMSRVRQQEARKRAEEHARWMARHAHRGNRHQSGTRHHRYCHR